MAEETSLIALNGQVEVRRTREGQWVSASKNMGIPEGGGLRTGANGSAVALMPNKTKIWLKESTGLEIEQRQTLTSRLALVFGKIKLRVTHLMRKERFEVRTPAAVCAVRGTEFTLETTESGKMDINVLYGEVKLNFIVPPAKGAAELYIPQGQNMKLEERGKAGKVTLMDPKQERAALENWNPGLKPEERQKELQTKENDRAQIKEYAVVTNNSESSVKTFLNTVKESDLEAGRTLRDVHGNMVRVEQIMMRPHSDEIQIINLVKRPVYTNDTAASLDRGGFHYNGAASVSDRLDLLQMTMNFSNDLPQRIEDWPGFFNNNDVKADWMSLVTANKTKADEIFFMAQGAVKDPLSGDLKSNTGIVGIDVNSMLGSDNDVLITGILKTGGGVGAADGLDKIARLNIIDANSNDGKLKYYEGGVAGAAVNANGSDVRWAAKMNYDTVFSPTSPGPGGWTDNYEKKGDPYLWDYNATPYAIGNNDSANGRLWLAQETYVINNAGSIQQADDFTKSSLDPFTLLNNAAGEEVLYIKASNATTPDTWTSNANIYNDISQNDKFAYDGGAGTNIDLVVIPDLMISALQRMLPALTNLNN